MSWRVAGAVGREQLRLAAQQLCCFMAAGAVFRLFSKQPMPFRACGCCFNARRYSWCGCWLRAAPRQRSSSSRERDRESSRSRQPGSSRSRQQGSSSCSKMLRASWLGKLAAQLDCQAACGELAAVNKLYTVPIMSAAFYHLECQKTCH